MTDKNMAEEYFSRRNTRGMTDHDHEITIPSCLGP